MHGPNETHTQDRSNSPDLADTPLCELSVLAVDCQTTGADPNKGRLLEIGWMCGCAAFRPEITDTRSCLIRGPQDTSIPAAVRRITGISETDLCNAISEKTAWADLMTASEDVAALNRSCACPLVIHFARFETPFLQRLHESGNPGKPFPFQIICTHAIARRLLPELPRRGIRALAGYFGHAVPEMKRSADHVLATIVIWKNLVALLQSRHNVSTLRALAVWLTVHPLQNRAPRVFPMHPEARRTLPDKPGIYRMRRANRDILYIGKAKSLKQRVRSYFRSRATHAEHILEMLTQARELDFTTTESALEAAVMESDEIKRHCPPYNIALRPEERSLIFCTRDLLHWSTRCDRKFCVGPLPGGRSIGALSAFAEWFIHDKLPNIEAIGSAILGFSSMFKPNIATLQAGFDLFRSTYRDRFNHPSALRVVASLGAHLWRQELASHRESGPAMKSKDNCAETLQEENPKRLTEWTPADVAGAIEGMLVHSAHMMRRARWFHLIVDSCLAWAAADDRHTLRHLLVFEKGIVVQRGRLQSAGKLRATPECGRSWPVEQKNMDLPAYDRMRVVTTELRRLVCEGRAIELRLSPKILLTTCELKKALQWL